MRRENSILTSLSRFLPLVQSNLCLILLSSLPLRQALIINIALVSPTLFSIAESVFHYRACSSCIRKSAYSQLMISHEWKATNTGRMWATVDYHIRSAEHARENGRKVDFLFLPKLSEYLGLFPSGFSPRLCSPVNKFPHPHHC